jgi:hypothetical protein
MDWSSIHSRAVDRGWLLTVHRSPSKVASGLGIDRTEKVFARRPVTAAGVDETVRRLPMVNAGMTPRDLPGLPAARRALDAGSLAELPDDGTGRSRGERDDTASPGSALETGYLGSRRRQWTGGDQFIPG